MNNLPKLEDILNLLNESGNHINGVLESKTLHAADIDLIKHKLLQVYDIALSLSPESEASSVIEKTPPVEKILEPVEKNVVIDNEPFFEIETTEPSKMEQISRKIKEETAAELQVKEQKREEAKKNKLSEVIEKQHAQKSLNDQLSHKVPHGDLSQKLQSQPITDIQKAIGLNDRFLFINELFDGNKDQYQQTISILNQQNNFNEAYDYLRATFQWKMDNPVVQQLLTIIRRKLIKSNNE